MFYFNHQVLSTDLVDINAMYAFLVQLFGALKPPETWPSPPGFTGRDVGMDRSTIEWWGFGSWFGFRSAMRRLQLGGEPGEWRHKSWHGEQCGESLVVELWELPLSVLHCQGPCCPATCFFFLWGGGWWSDAPFKGSRVGNKKRWQCKTTRTRMSWDSMLWGTLIPHAHV